MNRRGPAILLLVLLLVPAGIATAATQRLFLRGGGVPVTVLTPNAPSASSVPNYDWLRNGDPGVTIQPGGTWNTSTTSRYQDFLIGFENQSVSGAASLQIWSAVPDFTPGVPGSLDAYLIDCNEWGIGCVLVADAGVSSGNWNPDGEWRLHTITFPPTDHEFGEDRILKIRITTDADDEMWIAYDSTATPSSLSLSVDEEPPPTTTTTTTTTTSTTTSSSTSSTTTTTSTSTTSTTTPSSSTTSPSSTTTTPDSTTTTGIGTPTTAPPDGSTTSTTSGGAQAGTEPEPETTTTSIGASPSPSGPSATPPESAPDTEGDRVAPVAIDRAALLVTEQGDVAVIQLEPPARTEIGPVEQLSIAFRSATETIRSSVISSLLLGLIGSVLSITLFEQRRVDVMGRLASAVSDFPRSFPPMWNTLRSRSRQRR